MLGRVLSAAAVAALVVPTILSWTAPAEAKPKWKEERGWGGGPPPWAPAHGWRRKHERGGGYGYGSRPVEYRYGYEPRGYSRW